LCVVVEAKSNGGGHKTSREKNIQGHWKATECDCSILASIYDTWLGRSYGRHQAGANIMNFINLKLQDISLVFGNIILSLEILIFFNKH